MNGQLLITDGSDISETAPESIQPDEPLAVKSCLCDDPECKLDHHAKTHVTNIQRANKIVMHYQRKRKPGHMFRPQDFEQLLDAALQFRKEFIALGMRRWLQ